MEAAYRLRARADAICSIGDYAGFFLLFCQGVPWLPPCGRGAGSAGHAGGLLDPETRTGGACAEAGGVSPCSILRASPACSTCGTPGVAGAGAGDRQVRRQPQQGHRHRWPGRCPEERRGGKTVDLGGRRTTKEKQPGHHQTQRAAADRLRPQPQDPGEGKPDRAPGPAHCRDGQQRHRPGEAAFRGAPGWECGGPDAVPAQALTRPDQGPDQGPNWGYAEVLPPHGAIYFVVHGA